MDLLKKHVFPSLSPRNEGLIEARADREELLLVVLETSKDDADAATAPKGGVPVERAKAPDGRDAPWHGVPQKDREDQGRDEEEPRFAAERAAPPAVEDGERSRRD